LLFTPSTNNPSSKYEDKTRCRFSLIHIVTNTTLEALENKKKDMEIKRKENIFRRKRIKRIEQKAIRTYERARKKNINNNIKQSKPFERLPPCLFAKYKRLYSSAKRRRRRFIKPLD